MPVLAALLIALARRARRSPWPSWPHARAGARAACATSRAPSSSLARSWSEDGSSRGRVCARRAAGHAAPSWRSSPSRPAAATRWRSPRPPTRRARRARSCRSTASDVAGRAGVPDAARRSHVGDPRERPRTAASCSTGTRARVAPPAARPPRRPDRRGARPRLARAARRAAGRRATSSWRSSADEVGARDRARRARRAARPPGAHRRADRAAEPARVERGGRDARWRAPSAPAQPLCVALLDLDHFKAYNDAHGHPAGDAHLRRTAAAWRRELRAIDVLARYGGEEFGVLLPDTDLAKAHEVHRPRARRDARTARPRRPASSSTTGASRATRCSPAPTPRCIAPSTRGARRPSPLDSRVSKMTPPSRIGGSLGQATTQPDRAGRRDHRRRPRHRQGDRRGVHPAGHEGRDRRPRPRRGAAHRRPARRRARSRSSSTSPTAPRSRRFLDEVEQQLGPSTCSSTTRGSCRSARSRPRTTRPRSARSTSTSTASCSG